MMMGSGFQGLKPNHLSFDEVVFGLGSLVLERPSDHKRLEERKKETKT